LSDDRPFRPIRRRCFACENVTCDGRKQCNVRFQRQTECGITNAQDLDGSEGHLNRKKTAMGQPERRSPNLASVGRPKAAVGIGSAFCAALGLAALVLAALGPGERGTIAALQVTARFSFLLFWLAYTGGAMTALFGPAFEPFKKRAREFGLAFASAHLVHIALVAWLTYIGKARGFLSFLESPSCGPTFLRCSRSLACNKRWGPTDGGSYAWWDSII
jgi:hypothetical protein